MRFLYSVLCLILFASASFGQVGTVRTGEHDSFTRVVVTIPDGADWRFGRTLTGYALRLPDVTEYALDGFFELIPQTRIESVSQTAGDLELNINCVCSARAYRFRENFLVIDVRDGPASRLSPFELSLAPSEADPALVPAPQTEIDAEFVVSEQRSVPLFVVRDQVAEIADEMTPESQKPISTTPFGQPDSRGYVDSVSQEVATALGAAMSLGFLEAEIAPDADVAGPRADPNTLGNSIILAVPGIETRTGTDPRTGVQVPPEAQSQTGMICLSDEFFAIESWGDARPFNVQLGEARQRIFGEFDEPDPIEVIKLAKVFLHFGFGREAVQSLELDESDSRERSYLLAIAQLLDDEVGQTDQLVDQASCPAKVSMWAILATGDQPLKGQIDRLVVLRTFKALPAHLRPIVGPRLAQAFMRVNDIDAADQVLNRATAEGLDPVSAALGASSLATASGDAQGAFDIVQEAILSGADVTPDAMAAFFELGLEIGNRFDPVDFEFANAIRFQNSGLDSADQLLEAQFRAYLAQDQFSEARTMIEDAALQPNRAALTAMIVAYQKKAVDRMPDAVFGRFVWEENFLPANAEIQQDVADRLMAMGFVGRANEVLELDVGLEELPKAALNLIGRPLSAVSLEAEPSALGVNAVGNDLAGAQVEPQASDSLFNPPQEVITNTDPSLAAALALIGDSAASRGTIQQTLDLLQIENIPLPAISANDP